MSALAVGVGCRRGAAARDIAALVSRALAGRAGAALYSIDSKQNERGLAEAAADLGLPLVYLSRETLALAASGAVTRSARVLAMHGIPSVAETAALAGAGAGARLTMPRIAENGVTCAIAEGAGATT